MNDFLNKPGDGIEGDRMKETGASPNHLKSDLMKISTVANKLDFFSDSKFKTFSKKQQASPTQFDDN